MQVFSVKLNEHMQSYFGPTYLVGKICARHRIIIPGSVEDGIGRTNDVMQRQSVCETPISVFK
ncbi:MAG: hypothetical protein H8E42_10620 [Nitrospinae bacterium]|nr:hypothetical protein [Nitrospinota bacterium]MBL7020017.1 hypothetical protein [Nitrospinaceae bacterium]